MKIFRPPANFATFIYSLGGYISKNRYLVSIYVRKRNYSVSRLSSYGYALISQSTDVFMCIEHKYKCYCRCYWTRKHRLPDCNKFKISTKSSYSLTVISSKIVYSSPKVALIKPKASDNLTEVIPIDSPQACCIPLGSTEPYTTLSKIISSETRLYIKAFKILGCIARWSGIKLSSK